MPKETAARDARHERQYRPQQCQYPGGSCTNERSLKKNGEHHWLCAAHRDHQNVMQRDRYRRNVVKAKKARANENAAKGKTKNKEKAKRVSSSPHIIHKSAASKPATASANHNHVAAAPVQPPVTNHVRIPSAREEVQNGFLMWRSSLKAPVFLHNVDARQAHGMLLLMHSPPKLCIF
ncbi:hypothetical protein JG687_00018336 [Phytophthora cactorum]|nr:hypothetical protein Pcac1_g26515 [Phytophthora cactorum]KAG3043154.1 hypothetical protein PC121_g22734 [Phytophthora cactorum]KAG3208451.1 hypothetical protein PC129_g20524 [Phytophthora cactorum]KAG6943631.1 hypothetical protein JG687_00018336 [Phytophthora cactorum]RAW23074.1 hypothetical protein PC110_g20489 [Phytophthora cactorum]